MTEIPKPQDERLTYVLRFLPFAVVILLAALIFYVWPSEDQYGPVYLNWINIGLLLLVAFIAFVFGIRSFSTRQESAGLNLRTKLITVMVLMVLLPSAILQITANQVITKGLDVWFDVRVDTLLDKAMNLAQGFYADLESDMELSLKQVISDDSFPDLAPTPLGSMVLNQYMEQLLTKHGWDRLELFDASERLVATVQGVRPGSSLDNLKTLPVSDAGRLSIALGRYTIDHHTHKDSEYVVGYLPLFSQRRLIGLFRAEVELPPEITASARSIEADYRKYRELDRHRQGIQQTFMHTLMIAMILIVCVAGMLALVFARKLTAPVEELASALEQVKAGDFDVVVPTNSSDELGSLAESFNSMIARLKYNMDTLTETQTELTSALVSSRQRQYVLENLLAKLHSGVILLDATGEIRLMNDTCKTLLMLPKHKENKGSIYDFSEVHLKPILGFFETLQTQDLQDLQHEIVITYGLQTVKILARGTLLGGQHDVFSGWLLVFDDITQLAEAQKHRAWAEVAQRLAHEIKNPLTPIKLSTERVRRRFRDQVDDVKVFDTCTDAVINQVERLQRLLADFSDLATLPKPDMEVVSIATLLQELKELYSPYHNLTFEGMPKGQVYCDPDQIRQVLINLIDNALATKAHVRVYVEIVDEQTRFFVQDEGSGIDENAREHIFAPYFSTKKDGSGLGLAIAQRITEEHHGQLQLLSASAPTRFCMWLPNVENHRSKEGDA
ncbi:MAG TPA: HAMP domain-containing protein [Mariprofundaceae bacterium]|nr:HAMP domain-containing protein [Mariprofundaceae bacterium]